MEKADEFDPRAPHTFSLPGVKPLLVFTSSVTETEGQKQKTAPEDILFGPTKHGVRSQ